jgi:CheY-like chemotaxis protein
MDDLLKIADNPAALEIIENLLEQCSEKELLINKLAEKLKIAEAQLSSHALLVNSAPEPLEDIEMPVLEAEGTPNGILIVDTCDVMRLLLKGLLVANNFEVIGSAKNIGEAIKILKKMKPAIAMVEHALPLADGLDLTRKIKASYPDTIVLLIGVDQDNDLIARGRQVGVDDFFSKPIESKQFLKAVKEYLENGHREPSEGSPFSFETKRDESSG